MAYLNGLEPKKGFGSLRDPSVSQRFGFSVSVVISLIKIKKIEGARGGVGW